MLPVRTGCAYDPAGLVGNTPVLWIDRPFTTSGRGFWAKLESANPGGIKDRPALHAVGRARETGALRPGAPVVESSSGTYALDLALAGVVYGHPVTIVTDPGLEQSMLRLLEAYGASVDVVTAAHPRADGSGPAATASPHWSPPRPERGARTSTTTQTMSPPTAPSPPSSSHSSAGPTSWSPASAPAATRPASSARCASTRRTPNWSAWTRSGRYCSDSRTHPGSCAASATASAPPI
jgi:Pyridoxal-phosphate dependent enzyme